MFPVSGQQIFGVCGVVLATLGAIFFWKAEDPTDTLEEAQLAIFGADRIAKERDQLVQTFEILDEIGLRLKSLHIISGRAFGVLEQAAAAQTEDELQLINACLWSTKTDLRIALGYTHDQVWTICVYQRQPEPTSGKSMLVCVAHDRSIECAAKDARKWKEGVGVGGMALASNSEVVAPDILDPGAGSLFHLNGDIVRNIDLQRYRSMIAVPVLVRGDDEPWGVVLASNSSPYHFGGVDFDEEELTWGIQPEEAVRLLAGIVAAAVALARTNASEVTKSSGGMTGPSDSPTSEAKGETL